MTGRFFDQATPEAIADVVSSLLVKPLPHQPILDHAGRYSEQAFIDRLFQLVSSQRLPKQLVGAA